MVASACCRKARWLAALWLALNGTAHAQVSSQAELTCLLDSGDLLGESAQAARLEDPPWQTLASLRRGDENRARLALSTLQDGFLPGVTTSALLRVELGLNEPATSQAGHLRDVSSSLAVSFSLARRTQLSLRAFPFDTDYLRLGYLHALDWGGTDAERGESIFLQQAGGVPGLQVVFEASRIRLFAALKWASVEDALRGRRRAWGALSGGIVELSASLRVEGGFGYFQRPPPALAPTSAPSFVEGASLRIVWHRGATAPELSAEPFRPPTLIEDPPRLAAEMAPGLALALEGVTLVERLQRFESPGATALEPAPAAALYGSARGQSLAAHAAVTWRSLAFVVRNDARLARGETLPPSAVEHAELTAWLGGSVSVRPLYLVPSVELGLRLPAAVETPSVLAGFGQTLVAAGPAGLEALPIGAGRLPVVSARLGARFQASSAVALALFADFERNPNRVAFVASTQGVTRGFARPERLELVAAAQARF
jgi:hypothetical protein